MLDEEYRPPPGIVAYIDQRMAAARGNIKSSFEARALAARVTYEIQENFMRYDLRVAFLPDESTGDNFQFALRSVV